VRAAIRARPGVAMPVIVELLTHQFAVPSLAPRRGIAKA
jgi:hypothetical protein